MHTPHIEPLLRRLRQLPGSARQAFLVSLGVSIAIVAFALAHPDAPSRETSPAPAAKREHRAPTPVKAPGAKPDPRRILRLADGQADDGAMGVDGDGDEAALARGALLGSLAAAGAEAQDATQGTSDARTLVAALEADAADAFVAESEPTPEQVAEALGAPVACGGDLAEQWRALHAAAHAHGLRLLRLDAEEGEPLPRLLVVRAEALERLPQLTAMARLTDARALLVADSNSYGLSTAADAAFGYGQVGSEDVAPKWRQVVVDHDLGALAAATDARLVDIAAEATTADALADSFTAADAGDYDKAAHALAGVQRERMTGKGARLFDRAQRQLAQHKPAAADTLLTLSEAAQSARTADAELGAQAQQSLAWSALAAEPKAAVASVSCEAR